MGRRWEYTHADGSVISFEYRPGGTVDVIIAEADTSCESGRIAEFVGLPIDGLFDARRAMHMFWETDVDAD